MYVLVKPNEMKETTALACSVGFIQRLSKCKMLYIDMPTSWLASVNDSLVSNSHQALIRTFADFIDD